MPPSQMGQQMVLTSAWVEDGGSEKALWCLTHRPGSNTGHAVNTKPVPGAQMRSVTCSCPWRQDEVLDHSFIKAERHQVGGQHWFVEECPLENIWVPGSSWICLLLSSKPVHCTPHFPSPSIFWWHLRPDVALRRRCLASGQWPVLMLLCSHLQTLPALCTVPTCSAPAPCARHAYPWACFVHSGYHNLGSNVQLIA